MMRPEPPPPPSARAITDAVRVLLAASPRAVFCAAKQELGSSKAARRAFAQLSDAPPHPRGLARRSLALVTLLAALAMHAANASPSAAPSTCEEEGMLRQLDDVIDRARAREIALDLEDAFDSDTGPKEIRVHCPVDPEVKISELSAERVVENECMVLEITAPELSARLALRCDGELGSAEVG